MKTFPFLLIFTVFSYSFYCSGQTFNLGWTGNEIIPKSQFANVLNWNPAYSQGETCFVTTDTSNVYLHWKFGTGNRAKWAICFQILDESIVLNDSDIIGIDVKGSSCKEYRNVRIKFEDGINQVAYIWHGLASLTRWCERLVVLKKQFEGSINWNNIKVITFEVSSEASANDTQSDSGIVVFRKLKRDNVVNWQRASAFETLKDTSLLDTIKSQAINALLSRQTPTGLFYTWEEDKSSWLYGHGILLKLLTIEGEWNNALPANDCAVAAEKLALFLINHQDSKGFWPRAWNTDDGTIKVYLESDGTVWMGDFPWIITGLVNYYAKSGDARVIPAIQKAKSFLYNLIDPDGKFYTMNVNTNIKYPVNGAEAYAAAIQSVYELGNSIKALSMLNYISERTWDNDLKYWKESIYSKRPVLFANTWLAQLMFHISDYQKAYNGLSFIGKAMNTKGPGNPEGLDGIGPVAAWYEGTLSYICAGGPGSQMLMDSLVKYRFPDGSVPAYNDNIGAKVDIWAVDWSSLDATLWLYFAAIKGSPFKTYYVTSDFTEIEIPEKVSKIKIFPNPGKGKLYVENGNKNEPIKIISVLNSLGCLVYQYIPPKDQIQIELNLTGLKPGIYIVQFQLNGFYTTRKIELL